MGAMIKPTWILFDVGDVLLNWQASSRHLAKQLGVEHTDLLDAIFKYADDMFVGNLDTVTGWELILKELGITQDPWEMVLAWRHTDFWFSESLRLVRKLEAAGYSMAIMTNSWLELNDLEHRDLLPQELEAFSYIFDSSEAGLKKPDPAFYALVEAKLGTKGDNILLIDDAVKNKKPALDRGWQFFQYETVNDDGKASARQLEKLLI